MKRRRQGLAGTSEQHADIAARGLRALHTNFAAMGCTERFILIGATRAHIGQIDERDPRRLEYRKRLNDAWDRAVQRGCVCKRIAR